jgi:hypothetical protein
LRAVKNEGGLNIDLSASEVDVKQDIIRLCLLALAFLLAEATVAPALLFEASWAGIVLNAYIALGFGLGFFGLVTTRLNRDERRHVLEAFIVDVVNPSRGARLRARLYTWMWAIISVTCWPPMHLGLHSFRLMRSFNRMNSSLSAASGLALFPFEVSVSAFVAVVPAILTLIAVYREPPFVYSIIFLWILVFSIFLKHLSSMISGSTIQTKLRRGMDPVILSYSIITLGDLVGLILSYNAIINWNSGSIFSPEGVSKIFKDLLVFKDFIEAYEHLPDNFLAYCVGISGLLWWLTLAQGLFQLKGYRRTPADYLGLAACCTMLGKDDRATAFLEAAAASTKDECIQKGQIHAARGEFDKAVVSVRRALNQTDDVPPTDGYILMIIWGGLFTYRSGEDRIRQFMEYAVGRGLTDGLLTNLVLAYCAGGGNASALADFVRQGPLHRFQLTYLSLKCAADEGREILDLFQQCEPTSPGADRAQWLCLGALLWPARRNSDEETGQFIEHWSEASLKEIRAIGISMTDDVEKCSLVDLLFRVYACWNLPGMHPIWSVIAEIEQTLPDNEIVNKIKSAWLTMTPAPRSGETASVPPMGNALRSDNQVLGTA